MTQMAQAITALATQPRPASAIPRHMAFVEKPMPFKGTFSVDVGAWDFCAVWWQGLDNASVIDGKTEC